MKLLLLLALAKACQSQYMLQLEVLQGQEDPGEGVYKNFVGIPEFVGTEAVNESKLRAVQRHTDEPRNVFRYNSLFWDVLPISKRGPDAFLLEFQKKVGSSYKPAGLVGVWCGSIEGPCSENAWPAAGVVTYPRSLKQFEQIETYALGFKGFSDFNKFRNDGASLLRPTAGTTLPKMDLGKKFPLMLTKEQDFSWRRNTLDSRDVFYACLPGRERFRKTEDRHWTIFFSAPTEQTGLQDIEARCVKIGLSLVRGLTEEALHQRELYRNYMDHRSYDENVAREKVHLANNPQYVPLQRPQQAPAPPSQTNIDDGRLKTYMNKAFPNKKSSNVVPIQAPIEPMAIETDNEPKGTVSLSNDAPERGWPLTNRIDTNFNRLWGSADKQGVEADIAHLNVPIEQRETKKEKKPKPLVPTFPYTFPPTGSKPPPPASPSPGSIYSHISNYGQGPIKSALGKRKADYKESSNFAQPQVQQQQQQQQLPEPREPLTYNDGIFPIIRKFGYIPIVQELAKDYRTTYLPDPYAEYDPPYMAQTPTPPLGTKVGFKNRIKKKKKEADDDGKFRMDALDKTKKPGPKKDDPERDTKV